MRKASEAEAPATTVIQCGGWQALIPKTCSAFARQPPSVMGGSFFGSSLQVLSWEIAVQSKLRAEMVRSGSSCSLGMAPSSGGSTLNTGLASQLTVLTTHYYGSISEPGSASQFNSNLPLVYLTLEPRAILEITVRVSLWQELFYWSPDRFRNCTWSRTLNATWPLISD